MHPPPWLQNLLHRRVPQFLAAYLGAGLALIPFVGFLVDTYELPKALLNAVIVAYVSVIPSVFLLAYNHGAPGKDPWILAERLGVPLNLMLTACLLGYTLFYSGPAEATTDTVVITDEAGNAVEHLVPKAKYRRKLAVYFWANESGDASLDWLRYGFPMMLERDLEQNRFLAATTPFSESMLTRLRRAGYENGLDVPVALQQEIADHFSLPAFVDGRFAAADGRLSARVTLYDTETAAPVAEHAVEGDEPAAMVDELTDWLKAELEIEDVEGLGPDLPAAEQLSASREALEKWVAGNVAEGLSNDLETALVDLRAAVELDPSFARAHYEIARSHYRLGKTEDAKAAMRDVHKHQYRLSERDRFFVKGFAAHVDRDNDRSIASFETVAKLYPDDVAALGTLAAIYTESNRIADAIATYRRILEFDANEDWALKEIGDLHVAGHAYGDALDAYQRYAERHDDDAGIQFSIARLHQAQGELAAARETVEKASVLATDPIEPALLLSQIDLAAGEIAAAKGRLQEAEAEAGAPQDVARVLGARLSLLVWTGEIGEALALWPRVREVQMQITPPISVKLQEGFLVASLYGLLDRRAAAEAWIEDHVKGLDPPFDQFRDLYLLQLYTVVDDVDGIEAHLETSRETLRKFTSRPDSMATLDLSKGRALELREDPAAAAAVYRSVLDTLDSSTLNLISSEVRVQALVFYAQASIDAGDLEAAAGSLEQALTTLPAHPGSNVQMARLERARGDLAAARRHLDVALTVWSDADPEYRTAKAARELAAELGG
jgi:tetratricopeptide (TPR) repeat protein